MLCAADSSCFFTLTGMWYWVANWCKCCVLQTAFASLHSTECDTEFLIGINVVCCRRQLLFTLTVMWYWVANCYNYCVLQAAVASLHSHGMWYWFANWYKCCVLQKGVASFHSTEYDTEWPIGINVVCCRQQLVFYTQRNVIVSG